MKKSLVPDSLLKRMEKLGIDVSKLQETSVRSSGSGGQNVNKVETCVQLYDPTYDVHVDCQEERKKGQNRIGALKKLCQKVEDMLAAEEAARKKALHVKRAKNKKRSKKSKERMLKDKHHRSKTKQSRGKVKDYE